jgi:hypothetical protein
MGSYTRIPALAPGSFFAITKNNMQRLALVATFALTLTVYWIGLSGPLIFDDAQNLTPLAEWVQGTRGWASVVFGNTSGSFGRPVSMASFLLNAMWLGPDVWGFKLVNLLLHLVNGALVFALFNGFSRQEALIRDQPAGSRWLPWLAASVWMLHPLFVSTVLYVVQRMAMLSALFMLVAMLAYLHGRMAMVARDKRRAFVLLVLVMPIATVLATLSKENGILAPALCGVIELALFQPRAGARRQWPSRAFIGITLVAPALVAIALTASQSRWIVAGYANRPFTLLERLLTQPRVLWDYIGSLLLPYGPGLGLYHDDYPVSHGLLDPASTSLALAAWVGLLVAAVILRRRIPGLALGAGLFLVGHALESTVFPLLMYFEHRNYLPAIGAIWAVISLAAFAASALKRHMHQPRLVFGLAAGALVLVLAMATAARAGIWQSQRTILAQALKYHPQSAWLRMDLASQAMHQHPSRWDEARNHVDALQSSPDASTRRLASVARLVVDCAAGTAPQQSNIAEAFQGPPVAIQANLLVAYENLSEGVMKQPCPDFPPLEMAGLLSTMLDHDPLPAWDRNISRLRLKAAKLYLTSGHGDEALAEARMAYANGGSEPAVAVFIAALLLQRNDLAGAAKMLDSAEKRMSRDDTTGHAFVARYRAEIQRRQR